MSLKLATAVLLAAVVTAGRASACMGSTVIFQDDFQVLNPAWHGPLTVSGGQANVTARAYQFGGAFYGGKIIDSGDYCVDLVGPTPADKSVPAAGIIFGFTDVDNYYALIVEENGKADVIQHLVHDGQPASLAPVALKAAPALKQGANVPNTLRVTWSGTSAAAYINDQPFWTFNIQALQNTMIGLLVAPGWASGQSPPMTYRFSNLKVTNAP